MNHPSSAIITKTKRPTIVMVKVMVITDHKINRIIWFILFGLERVRG